MGRAVPRRRGQRLRVQSPEQLGVALQHLVDRLGIAKTLRQYDVLTSWESIVGEKIAHVTKAQRIENGILYVSVQTAPWRAELAMKRVEIMEKINQRFGGKIVKDVRFR
jgi:predicted nucleic acid-binding Zn ribbon protein